MAELTAPVPRVAAPFTLDIRQMLRAAQRLFTILVVLHLIWSIGVTTNVFGRLATHFTSDNPIPFLVNFWLISAGSAASARADPDRGHAAVDRDPAG